jgi:DNA-binding response OmpR family regulator
MLAYSGAGPRAHRACDLSELIRELEPELHGFCGAHGLSVALAAGPAVEADPEQLRMVVQNLIANAVEASAGRQSSGIRLSIASRWCPAEELFDVTPPLLAGDYVVLEVTDAGSGIDPQLREQVLAPFVSSKFLGRGLGLSAVYGLARSLGGAVQIRPRAPCGTSVRVFLPAAGSAPRHGSTAGQALRGRVLVAEQDPLARQLARLTLQSIGLQVCVADSDAAAAQLLADQADELELVLLDERMAATNGPLWRQLAAQRDPPTILLVRRSAPEPTQAGDAAQAFLQRPWNVPELIARVQAALQERRSLRQLAFDTAESGRRRPASARQRPEAHPRAASEARKAVAAARALVNMGRALIHNREVLRAD